MYRHAVPEALPKVATILALLLGACTTANPPAHPESPQAAPPAATSSASPSPRPAAVLVEPNAAPGASSPPQRTKETGCTVRGPLPDPTCTPGAAMTTDMTVVCQHSTKERRNVSSEVHRQAFTEYGFTYPQPHGAFEVDHLIPLELGGDNVMANLWPEAAEPTPGFHQKDKVENYLHRQVCSGAMSLADAQRQIAIDWIKVWHQIKGRAPAAEVGQDERD
jgi:hypothetical protein